MVRHLHCCKLNNQRDVFQNEVQRGWRVGGWVSVSEINWSWELCWLFFPPRTPNVYLLVKVNTSLNKKKCLWHIWAVWDLLFLSLFRLFHSSANQKPCATVIMLMWSHWHAKLATWHDPSPQKASKVDWKAISMQKSWSLHNSFTFDSISTSEYSDVLTKRIQLKFILPHLFTKRKLQMTCRSM